MRLLKNLKWRGRRYLAGLIHGVGIGICIGLLIALQLDWSNKPFILQIIIMIGIPFIGILGHFVLSKAPEKIQGSKS